jgi:hypothetical protein
LARVSFRAAKIVSCNKNYFFHGLRSKLPQLFYFRCHSKITTELEKGNLRVWLLIVYCVITPFAAKRAPLFRGLSVRDSLLCIWYFKYTKMYLQPKRKYVTKQTLTNKYSEVRLSGEAVKRPIEYFISSSSVIWHEKCRHAHI